jgi:hypothetical protein
MTILGDALAGRDKSLDQVQGNAIRDVWYGRRELPETFWKWNFLIGGLGGAALGFLAGVVAAMVGSRVPLYLFIVLLLPYRVWITVGLWRSAGNAGGIWAVIVRVLVVIGVIYTPFQLENMFEQFRY